MIYVKREDGREVLFIGDIGWLMRNIETGKGRPRALSQFMLNEDRDAVFAELATLKALHAAEPDLSWCRGTTCAAVDALIAERRDDREVQALGLEPRRRQFEMRELEAGATVQPTSVQSPSASADCQAPRGTTPCGRWPAARSLPRMSDGLSRSVSSQRRAGVPVPDLGAVDAVPVPSGRRLRAGSRSASSAPGRRARHRERSGDTSRLRGAARARAAR